MVKIRMKRMGRRHRPYYRINAIDARAQRDGKVIEELGRYDPIEADETKQVVVNIERVQYWLDRGAQPSETVADILRKQGMMLKGDDKAKAKTTAEPKPAADAPAAE